MDFGYFTLSDNHYVDNRRDANAYILDIVDEAIYAESLGFRSAWIGEHHFSSLGVMSCPELALAYVAARTKRIRLAPAVTVLPLHHPIRVAEQWASLDLLSGGRVDFATGRGYDRNEYGPFQANFEENAAIFAEGIELVQRLWSSDEPLSHKGRYYALRERAHHAAAGAAPDSDVRRRRSRARRSSCAARLGLGLVVARVRRRHRMAGLQPAARLYREACAAVGQKARAARHAAISSILPTRHSRRCARASASFAITANATSHALPGDPRTAPANYAYFSAIVARYETMKPEDFTENAVLLGNSARIIDTLKAKVEAAGFDEAILYFNLGLKPHEQVKDEMARFMAEVAPQFAK